MRKMEQPKNKIISFDVTEAWDDAFQAEHSAFANAIQQVALDLKRALALEKMAA